MVESIMVRSQLRLVLNNGTDPDTNEVITKLKSFNNVSPRATAEQLYTVGHAFASLQTLPLYALERSDNSELVQDETE